MPIDVSAKLTRGSVFLAGEYVECLLTFTNKDSREPEMLAWASAQVIAQCFMNGAKLRSKFERKESGNSGSTSFVPDQGEQGAIVASNKPSILFCHIKLEPGATLTHTYREILPYDGPPSYRGHGIKYVYKMVIGIQKLDCPTRLMKLPLRVLVLPGLCEELVSELTAGPQAVRPSNPFRETDELERQNQTLDAAMYLLSEIAAKKTVSNFNIYNLRGTVLRCTLFKQSFVIGEDIIIVLDFSKATVPCVQFSVMLQSEEIIGLRPAPPLRILKSVDGQLNSSETSDALHSSSSTSDTQTNTTVGDTNHRSYIATHAERHCTCLSMQNTQISLHIPPSVTPSFGTDHVQLRWRLHFEFVILLHSLPRGPCQTQSRPVYWTPWDDEQGYETMSWDLPIKIYPSNPCLFAQVGSMCTTEQTRV